jgi:hypothetical protein
MKVFHFEGDSPGSYPAAVSMVGDPSEQEYIKIRDTSPPSNHDRYLVHGGRSAGFEFIWHGTWTTLKTVGRSL